MIIDSVFLDDNFYFKISNSSHLLNNKRIKISFKRLNYIQKDALILIPFYELEKVNKLDEIENIFKKYNFKYTLSEKLKNEESNYQREEELFDIFSNKAKLIRNNEFKDNPEIVKDLSDFRKVIYEKLERRLYKLQELSAFHMAFTQNSCNFAVPGAGKTSIVYGAYAYLNSLDKEDKRYVEKLLVIGPLSSFKPWEDEYEACFGHTTTFQRLSGGIDKEIRLQHLHSSNPAEVTLISHGGVDSLKEDIKAFLRNYNTMIVVDEAHKIKNYTGQWGTSVTEISKEAYSRIALTGTPVPNGYQDIYNIFKFIYPFKFKKIIGFNYQNLLDLSNHINDNSERVDKLKNNLSPYFIRIKKSDLNLPPKVENPPILVEMDEIQREVYDFIFNEYLPDLKNFSSSRSNEILTKAKLIRLRQVVTNPSLILRPITETLEHFNEDNNYEIIKNIEGPSMDDSELINKLKYYSENIIPNKFQEVVKLLNGTILPNKVIIWTIFVQNATQLRDFLITKGINSQLLIGSVPQDERELIIKKFNNPNNNEFSVVIANPFCVAESISLHKGCHNAIYLERDYNCANFLQSKDRIHRVGLDQNQITNYYYILTKHPNSIDEVIDNRLAEKIKRMENIINDEIPLFNLVSDNNDLDLIEDLIKLHDEELAKI